MSKALKKDPFISVILIISLAVLLLTSAVTFGGIRIDITEELHNFDTYQGYGNQIVMTEDGNVWLAIASEGDSDSLIVYRFDAWGTSYTRMEDPGAPQRWGEDAIIASYGDTAVVAFERIGDWYPTFATRMYGTTIQKDSARLALDSDTPDGRPMVFWIGEKIVVVSSEDGGVDTDPDSLVARSNDQIWPYSGSWRELPNGVSTTKFGIGQQAQVWSSGVPVGGLLHARSPGSDDLIYYDTIAGWTTLIVGLQDGATFTNYQLLMANDTDGVTITQWDSVYAVTFVLRDIGTASPTGAVKDTIPFLASGLIPTDSLCWPDLVQFVGSDTIVAYYLEWSDGSGDPSVARRISADGGDTWSAQVIVFSAVDGNTIHKLRWTPDIYTNPSGDRIAYGWFTEDDGVNANMAFLIDTISEGSAPPATSARRRRMLNR